MAATLVELENRVNRLNQRISLLATTEQVSDLQSLVSGWKTESDDTMTLFQANLDGQESRIQDLEIRVQALEA